MSSYHEYASELGFRKLIGITLQFRVGEISQTLKRLHTPEISHFVLSSFQYLTFF